MSTICSSFSCFNTELSSAIVCNTCIACNIYHLGHKCQYVVQLSRFILETLLTDLNTYLCITASLHHVKVYYNVLSHPVKCNECL